MLKIVRWLGNIVTFDRLSAKVTANQILRSTKEEKRKKKTGPSNKVWTEIVCLEKHVQSIFHQHVKSRIFRRLEMCANYSFLYCYFSHLSCVLFFFLLCSIFLIFHWKWPFLLYLHSKWYPKFDLFRLPHAKSKQKNTFFRIIVHTWKALRIAFEFLLVVCKTFISSKQRPNEPNENNKTWEKKI